MNSSSPPANFASAPTARHLLASLCCFLLWFASSVSANNQQGTFHQHNNILHFEISENSPNNTHIGNIKSADNQVPAYILPLRNENSAPELELLRAFRYDYSNGSLFTNSPLDREHRETYHFVAIAQNPFVEVKCSVTVRDTNDNSPMFLLGGPTNNNLISNNETNFVIEVPEGQRGVRRVLPLAVDLDSAQFGIKEFRIVSGNTPSGTFQLVEHEAPARSTLLPNLAQVSQADDAASSLSAFDNPRIQEQLNAQAVVLIPSQPTQAFHPTPINMNSGTTTAAISQATASSGASIQSSRFLIDLEVSQTLDRENQSSYQLVVEAIDGGQPPLIGRLLVTVNVQDVNDNDPVFTKKVYESYVQENAAKGTVLTRVQAYDADLDANAKISYFIRRQHNATSYSNNFSNNNNNNYTSSQSNLVTQRTRNGGFVSVNQQLSAEWFEIDQEKGEVYLVNQLDYEQDQMHEFIVEARDHGKPSRSSYATIKVFVTDVNDDPPALPISQYTDRNNNNNNLSATSPHRILNGSTAAELKKSSEFNYPNDNISRQTNFLQGFNLAAFFDQINSSTLFSLVLVGLILLAFPVCLVKIKSKKPEPDHYNDTAGLTLSPNGQQTKQSPNHYLNQDHQDRHSIQAQEQVHRHHNDHQHHSATGTIGQNGGGGGTMFGSLPSAKLRYQYSESSNLYHNPYTSTHRHNVHGANKGGTMNSLGTHHSVHHPSASPMPATPNTTHSSGLPTNLHDVVNGTHQIQHPHSQLLGSIPPPPSAHHHHHHHSHLPSPQDQKPPTPCNAPPNVFAWPQGPASTRIGFNGVSVNNGGTMATTCGVPAAIAAMTANSFSPLAVRAASSTTLDGWGDMSVPSQLVYAHDWCGSYNWDYLADWTPEYQTLMQLFPTN